MKIRRRTNQIIVNGTFASARMGYTFKREDSSILQTLEDERVYYLLGMQLA